MGAGCFFGFVGEHEYFKPVRATQQWSNMGEIGENEHKRRFQRFHGTQGKTSQECAAIFQSPGDKRLHKHFSDFRKNLHNQVRVAT